MRDILSKEAVVLSAIPIFSFVFALAFELGYADAFGYSISFVDIDLKITVVALFVVFIIMYPLFMYVEALYRLGTSAKITSRYLAIQLVMPFPLLLSCFISAFSSVTVNILLGLTSLLALSVGASYLLKVPKHGWLGAWELAAKNGGVKEFSGDRPESGPANIVDKIFAKLFLVVVLVVFLSVIRGVGSTVAHLKTSYDIFDLDGNSVAILAGYGDRLVLGSYSGNQFDGKVFILSKSSEKLNGVSRVVFQKFLPEQMLPPMLTKMPVDVVKPAIPFWVQ